MVVSPQTSAVAAVLSVSPVVLPASVVVLPAVSAVLPAAAVVLPGADADAVRLREKLYPSSVRLDELNSSVSRVSR